MKSALAETAAAATWEGTRGHILQPYLNDREAEGDVQVSAARAMLDKQRELDEQLGRGFVRAIQHALASWSADWPGLRRAGATKAGAAKAVGAAPSRGRKQPAAAAARQQPHAPQRRTQR